VRKADIELSVQYLPTQDVTRIALRLAGCAEPQMRDPHVTLALATRAVKYNAFDAQSWAALGVAVYRAGRWEELLSAWNTIEPLLDVPLAKEALRDIVLWQLANQQAHLPHD
jgi:hypothetical protein